MTKLTLRDRASAYSLRQMAMSSSVASFPNPSTTSETPLSSERSRNFVLADMDGRDTRDNRACPSCIAKLAPSELGQINWHVTEDQSCRLCDVADIQPAAFTKPFCDFLEENPTIFHTVEYFTKKLNHLGFKEVRPRSATHCLVATTDSRSSLLATHGPTRCNPAENIGLLETEAL
jgi:aminopeptidase I